MVFDKTKYGNKTFEKITYGKNFRKNIKRISNEYNESFDSNKSIEILDDSDSIIVEEIKPLYNVNESIEVLDSSDCKIVREIKPIYNLNEFKERNIKNQNSDIEISKYDEKDYFDENDICNIGFDCNTNTNMHFIITETLFEITLSNLKNMGLYISNI